MKFQLLSDNHDTLTGLRLAGIEGEIITSANQAEKRIWEIVADKDVGILLVTSTVYSLAAKSLDEIREQKTTPLVVEIPDRHGGVSHSVADYIRDAIG